MNMVKAEALTVMEAVKSEKKRRKQGLEEMIQDWEEEEEDKTEFMETKDTLLLPNGSLEVRADSGR